jgi:chorismate synthase
MSTFGTYFRVTTSGESHASAINVILDGVVPGLPLTEADVQPQLSRRRPGQSSITTPRSEDDACQILSGTEFGVTLGTPICIMVKNKDQRPKGKHHPPFTPHPSPLTPLTSHTQIMATQRWTSTPALAMPTGHT